jgi:hypothetical protein
MRMKTVAKMIEINNRAIIALKYIARKLSGFFLVILSITMSEARVSKKKKTRIIHTW